LYSALDELISQTDAKGKKPVLSYEKKNQKHYFMLVIKRATITCVAPNKEHLRLKIQVQHY
jgi:hypothetical protein